MRDDDASVHVLEAVLLSLILLGAAYSVSTLRDTATPAERQRSKLEALTNDALVVLDGLASENGRLLDLFFAEAYHCAVAEAQDPEMCDGPRSANLSLKLQSYLPAGIGFAYGIANGVEERVLYRSTLPEGETVIASRAVNPDWNLTFLASEMSCYESGMSAAMLAVPIWHGGLAKPAGVNVTIAASNATAVEEPAGTWRATLPAATRPASGIVRSAVNATDGTYPGVSRYDACDLGGLGPALAAAIQASTFAAAAPTPVGGTAILSYGLAPVAAVSGASLVSLHLTVYEPLPPRAGVADSYVPLGRLDLDPSQLAGVASFHVPPESLYGAHPAVLTARVDAGGGTVDLHRVTVLQVALPTGAVPIDAPYRVFVQTWFPDG